MSRTSSARLASAVAVSLATLASSATHSFAATETTVLDFPAGLACASFDLRVEILENPNRVSKGFKDKNGNVVRKLTAGKGNALTFTNLSTKETLSLKPNGSVEHVTINPDKSETWAVTGHNVLILFPTDVPAGPSTTLYVGRVVFLVEPNGVFTLQRASRNSTDICAALT